MKIILKYLINLKNDSLYLYTPYLIFIHGYFTTINLLIKNFKIII